MRPPWVQRPNVIAVLPLLLAAMSSCKGEQTAVGPGGEPSAPASSPAAMSVAPTIAHSAPIAQPSADNGVVSGGMVRIPPGTYKMGHQDSMLGNEKPLHTVEVKSFEIDINEVTVDGYRACVKASKCAEPHPGEDCNWGQSGKENHPVNCVDWNQAKAFCDWAGKRLPTEEEWEYAARGTDGRKYPWGNEKPSGRVCWYRTGGKEGKGSCEVASFPSGDSPFGLHDMTGNVDEWTGSSYSDNYLMPRTSSMFVVRGGSWSDKTVWTLVTSRRGATEPKDFTNWIGFRCAR